MSTLKLSKLHSIVIFTIRLTISVATNLMMYIQPIFLKEKYHVTIIFKSLPTCQ